MDGRDLAVFHQAKKRSFRFFKNSNTIQKAPVFFWCVFFVWFFFFLFFFFLVLFLSPPMSALSPPFGGGETTGLTLEDFSNIPEPLPSARGLPTHTRTLSLTTKIEERETRETTLRTSLPAPLASPPPPPRPFRPPRSSTKSSPNSPFYFTPSPSSPLLTGPSPSLPTKSTPSATTSEVLLRGGQTLESILNAPGPGGPGSIYAASPRITKRMTVQLASNYAEMNKSCLKKEASQVSPYQFNSIRLKKQTPKSMVDGTLFLAPLAKASRIVTNLDDGWEIETGSSVCTNPFSFFSLFSLSSLSSLS